MTPADGVELLVLPDATLGGYLTDLRDPRADLPPRSLATPPLKYLLHSIVRVSFGYRSGIVVISQKSYISKQYS